MKKIFIAFILVMFLISFTSGAEFDNVVKPIPITKGESVTIGDKVVPYNSIWEKYPPQKIDNLLGLGTTLMKGAITQHTDSCSGDCRSRFYITIAQDSPLVNSVRFNLAQPGSYSFYIKTGEHQETFTDTSCESIGKLINGSDNIKCTPFENTRIIEDWKPYTLGKIELAGDYVIEIRGSKNPNQKVDWIITSQGQEISDWAVWGSQTSIAEDYSTLPVWNTWEEIYDTRQVAQTFTAEYSTAQASNVTLRLKIADVQVPPIFNITIQGTNSSGAPNGTIISTAGFAISTINTSFWDRNFTLPTFSVVAGTNYSIILTNPISNSSAKINWALNASNIYPNGSRWASTSGVFWTPTVADDLAFMIWRITDVVSTTLNSPNNGNITNAQHIKFNASATVSNSAITNATLYLYNNDGSLNLTNTTTGLSGTSATTTWNLIMFSGNYSWNVQFCATNGNCGWGASNYTISIDNVAPSITIIHPTTIISYAYLNKNISLNYSITDNTGLSSCVFVYNSSNVSSSCTLNNSFLFDSTTKAVTIYATDTYGNTGSATRTWSYALFQNNISYTSTTASLANENYLLNFTYNSTLFNSASGLINWNNTNYSTTLTTDGANYYLNYSQTIPPVTTSQNITFYYILTLGNVGGGTTIVTTETNNQTLSPISIDDCSVNPNIILNLTMYDEDTNAYLNPINNGTINIDVKLSNIANSSNYQQYSVIKSNTSAVICVGAGVINNGYRLDGIIQYSSDNRITRFRYIQNYIILPTTILLNKTLYDLLTTESQEFKITYKDANFLLVPNALIEIQKYFVGAGYYATVEDGLTDNYGTTVGHFVLGGDIYKINVYVNGVLVSSYSAIIPVCNNLATGDCQINLNALSSPYQFMNWFTYDNLNYSYNFNEATRLLTLNWNIQNSEISNVNLTVLKYDAITNSTICSTEQSGNIGTFTCQVGTFWGNGTIEADLYKDGTFIGSNYFTISNGEQTTLGNTGIIIALIFVVCLALMFTSSPTGVIIGGILGIIMVGLMALLNYSNNNTMGSWAVASGIIYLIVAGIAILWKINKSGGGSV